MCDKIQLELTNERITMDKSNKVEIVLEVVPENPLLVERIHISIWYNQTLAKWVVMLVDSDLCTERRNKFKTFSGAENHALKLIGTYAVHKGMRVVFYHQNVYGGKNKPIIRL